MDSYFALLSRSYPLLLKGTWMTLQVLGAGATLSFSLGLGLGILSCNRLRLPFFSWCLEVCCFILRAVPFYVQLLILYFVLPELLNFSLDPFPASVLAIGLCSSGYVAQIVRAGINSIPVAQWEAAYVLGYTKKETLRWIILPQMVRNVLPAFTNELDSLLKSTAIVSSIGMLELTRMGMNLVSREMEPVAIYLTVALFYLSISCIINLFTRALERRIAYAKR